MNTNPAGIPVHVIQRGNDRQTLFNSDKDIAAYAISPTEGDYPPFGK
jgi:hypothetical protein